MYLHILRMIQVSHLMSEQLIIIRVDDRRRPERTESGETGAIRAGTIRHAGETAHREVDVVANNLVYGSKPGVKTFGVLTQRLSHHRTCVYTYLVL